MNLEFRIMNHGSRLHLFFMFQRYDVNNEL